MKINITKLKCSKCGAIWVPSQEEIFICPYCKCALEKYPPQILRKAEE